MRIARSLLVGASVGGTVVLLKWSWLPTGGLDLAEVARAVVVAMPLYLLLGAVLGLAAGLIGSRGRGLEVALPLCAWLIVGLALDTSHPLARLAIAVALAGLAWSIARVVRRLPERATATAAWTACAMLLSFVVARALPPAHESRFVLAVVVVVLPALGAVASLVLRHRLPLAAIAGVALSLLVSVALVDSMPERMPATRAAAGAPSVLLVTLDTTRADRIGPYGYAAARTPTLDALAEQGTVFRNVVTCSVETGPSHYALLTSTLPSTSGFTSNLTAPDEADLQQSTIADVLRGAGYLTSAFPSSYTAIKGGIPNGFDFVDAELRGFWFLPPQAYQLALIRPAAEQIKERFAQHALNYRPARFTADRATRWLERRATAGPFFAWVHFFDPHLPYHPPPELVRDARNADAADGRWYELSNGERAHMIASENAIERMRALYDAEIAYADRELARVVAAARESSDGNLWIVVTADHGEPMGEHGLYWRRDMYEPSVHVPLIVVPPEAVGPAVPVVEQQVRTIVIAPTLFALLGIADTAKRDGASLARLVHGEPDPGLPSHGLVIRVPSEQDLDTPAIGLRTADYKLIVRGAGFTGWGIWEQPETELYDLRADPDELRDISASRPEVRARLEKIAPEPMGIEHESPALTASARRQLEALGYVR